MLIRRAVTALGAAAALGLGVTALAGCGGEDAGAAADGRLVVVTTVSPITNLAANVAGGLAEVEGVVPEGENSHEFEPAPRVARTLARADVIFMNGLTLEEPTRALAEANLAEGAEIVQLGDLTIRPGEYAYDFSFPREAGRPNPHLWMNPLYALRYAGLIRDTLVRLDPENAAGYRANYDALAVRFAALDAALREATATVPEGQRRLLTYHDSYAYFAREYGWTVVGAIQPSDFSEPSARDVADLIRQVREQDVPAVFGSDVFPSPVLERIASETGARYVDDLRDDDLPGEPGDPEHSFLELLRFDFATIVAALGGNAAALAGLDTADLPDAEGVYPQ